MRKYIWKTVCQQKNIDYKINVQNSCFDVGTTVPESVLQKSIGNVHFEGVSSVHLGDVYRADVSINENKSAIVSIIFGATQLHSIILCGHNSKGVIHASDFIKPFSALLPNEIFICNNHDYYANITKVKVE